MLAQMLLGISACVAIEANFYDYFASEDLLRYYFARLKASCCSIARIQQEK
jgi:hypothetical protein